MLLIGLTGSLATGKSTVAKILSSPPYSLPHIDADQLARQAVEPGTRGYNAIVRHFGPTTPDLLLPPYSSSSPSSSSSTPSKSTPPPINRAALGRRVFGTSAARTRDRRMLNSIVHPAVRAAMAQLVAGYYVRGWWAVVLDIPLLYEAGLDVFCGAVVMVAVTSAEVQMGRLRARDVGLSAAEAEERVRSQGGVREKVARTRERGEGRGVVVWNDAGEEELRGRVAEVVRRLETGRRGWWRWWLWGSPWGAAVVALWEVWIGWRARRRWEARKEGEREGEGKKED